MQDWNTNSLTSWGMKEVTPDPDVVKGSVFHRLLQRAFPEWFPYDSSSFIHPFYTLETNSRFARTQGYEDVFKFNFKKIGHRDPQDHNDDGYEYDYSESLPKKPAKPVYLSDYAQVKSVLRNASDDFANPTFTDTSWFPKNVGELLVAGTTKSKIKSAIDVDPRMILDYFTAVARDIIKREVISVDTEQSIYQIDVTRE